MSDLRIVGVKRAKEGFVRIHLEQEFNLSQEKGCGLTPAQIFAGIKPKKSTYHHWTTVYSEQAINLAPTLKDIISNPPENEVPVVPTELTEKSWRMYIIESTDVRYIADLHGGTFIPEPKKFGNKILTNNGQPIYMATIIAQDSDGYTNKFVKHDN